jgi:hypothetical protein
MKTSVAVLAVLLCFAQPAAAAERTVRVQAQTKIVDGDRTWREPRSYSYAFEVEVISDEEGPKRERTRDERPFIEAYPGETYTVRIHNPLPVRVAANLSIDGLNSLTGKPGTPAGGRKWIIEPESWVDIGGWQVSERAARRFVFTSRGESYATWRSDSWGRDLAVNCGVIGVAYFWSQRDLDGYFADHPIVIRRPRRYEGPEMSKDLSRAPQGSAARNAAPAEEEQRAGTGMGQRESNPVRQVRFDYDRGMYRAAEAVVITYDFPEEPRHRPRPFEDRGYAPEQPGPARGGGDAGAGR